MVDDEPDGDPSPPTPDPQTHDAKGERASRRPSLPPSSGPARNYRVVLAALWIGAQLALVYTADRRADGAFGFRMFSESSSIKVALYRDLDVPRGPGDVSAQDRTTRAHVEGGVWAARSADGVVRRFSWYDRVPSPYWLFDQEMHASYGAATQLSRLQAALNDVATHVADDAETRRFALEVTVRRNGRDPVILWIASHDRALPLPSRPSPAPPNVDATTPPTDGGP